MWEFKETKLNEKHIQQFSGKIEVHIEYAK
jgi:hypothetical protein